MMARVSSTLLPLMILVGCGGSTADEPATADTGSNTGDTGSVVEDSFIPPEDVAANKDPITATENKWEWIPVAGTRCANGSETGIGVNLTTKSKKAIVYMMGGGACWDGTTCGFGLAANLGGYAKGNFDSDISKYGTTGPFARDDAENPFKDYSFFFIPYCTGDVHAGNKISDYGGKKYQHVGYVNMTYNFERIVPTLKARGVDYAVISGSSAGGFGALWNFPRFQDALGSATHVDIIDDGGPPLRPAYMPTTLQQTWNTAWGLDTTTPPGCEKCNAKDGYHNAIEYFATKYAGHRASIISSYQDNVIRNYFQISGPKMEEGLKDLADNVLTKAPDWRVYYVTGSKHVFLGEKLSSVTSGGVTLASFINKQVTNDMSWTSVRP
jgi:hypothetical protein